MAAYPGTFLKLRTCRRRRRSSRALCTAFACKSHDSGIPQRQDGYSGMVQRAVLVRHDALPRLHAGVAAAGQSQP